MKYFIKTFGCQMNFSDSERMMAFFEKHNFKPASKIEQADLAIFNTCGVRQAAEDRVYGLVHNLRLKNKNTVIIITGCLAHRHDVQRKMKGKADLYIPIAEFPSLFKKLPPKQSKRFKAAKADEKTKYLCIQPKYKNSKSASVPIMTGCNNFCAYCVVPYARGREWSRPAKDIINEIETLSKNGCQEITLLGQNVNSYNYKTLSFPALLDKLAVEFPKITFKFLTSHPKDYSNRLICVIAKHENISKEIHLPIQAGSNKILRAMNRPYTQKHYLYLIEKTRKKIPGIRFSTDVIVGFPGETEKDFQETVKIFKKVGFCLAFINKYSPRPGTAAYKLENNISWDEKKRREKILRTLVGISN